MGLLKNINKTSHANVVDGKLILTCPDAIAPVVWQMDLRETDESALEVQLQDNGQATLAQKVGKEKATAVATFESKDKAVKAMMAASSAMQSAHGQINAGHAGTEANALQAPARQTSEKKGGFFKFLFNAIATLAVLFLAYSIIMVMTGSGRVSQSSSSSSNAEPQSGQPMSADDFLRMQ